jgi:hypothetical protein
VHQRKPLRRPPNCWWTALSCVVVTNVSAMRSLQLWWSFSFVWGDGKLEGGWVGGCMMGGPIGRSID